MFTTFCTAIVCLWLGQAAPATEKEKAPKVFTDSVAIESGQIRGEVLGEAKDVHGFKGIPYAAPPVGELRWKAPQPAAKWDGVRDCVSFGNACPQRVPALMAAIPQMRINAPYNEDCLYLNVWAPADAKNKKLPVLYWIHGGGYTMGRLRSRSTMVSLSLVWGVSSSRSTIASVRSASSRIQHSAKNRRRTFRATTASLIRSMDWNG